MPGDFHIPLYDHDIMEYERDIIVYVFHIPECPGDIMPGYSHIPVSEEDTPPCPSPSVPNLPTRLPARQEVSTDPN